MTNILQTDKTLLTFQDINWNKLTESETRKAAYDLIDTWDFTANKDAAKRIVDAKTNSFSIETYMMNATLKGIRIKQAITRSAKKKQ